MQTSADIDRYVAAMRTTAGGQKIVGFDFAWEVTFQRHGMGAGDKAEVMQICYEENNGQQQVLLFMLYRLPLLPPQLQSFLLDPKITFIGVNVLGDLLKVGRDFNIIEKIN